MITEERVLEIQEEAAAARKKLTIRNNAVDLARGDVLVRLTKVLEIIPVSRSSWYAGIASGRYPAGVTLGRSRAWRLSDIMQILEGGAR